MGDGVIQPVLEVIGELLLAGILMLLLLAGTCILATPFILIFAAFDHGRFWPSVRRRYESVALSAFKFFERLL